MTKLGPHLEPMFLPAALARSQLPNRVCITMRGNEYSDVHEAPWNARAIWASCDIIKLSFRQNIRQNINHESTHVVIDSDSGA
jgi:hypothetical protein